MGDPRGAWEAPAGAVRAIDLDVDRDAFIEQFDREFGALDEAPAKDDTLLDTVRARAPWQRRLGRRIVRRPHAWFKRP